MTKNKNTYSILVLGIFTICNTKSKSKKKIKQKNKSNDKPVKRVLKIRKATFKKKITQRNNHFNSQRSNERLPSCTFHLEMLHQCIHVPCCI